MRKISLLSILWILVSSTFITADDAVIKQLQQLRKKLKPYFMSAPRPGFFQRRRIRKTIEKHGPEIAKEARKLRTLIIELRQEARQQLTREQLLKAAAVRDQFSGRRPAVKAVIFMSKLEIQERTQLAKLIRNLVMGDEQNLAANLQPLRAFLRNVVRPKFAGYIHLSEAQKIELRRIHEAKRTQIEAQVECIVRKIYRMRKAVRKELDPEQLEYIAANRDKVFQVILDFISTLPEDN